MVSGSDACDLTRARASAQLDGELSEFDQRLLERHLEGCLDCRAFVSQISGLAAVLRSAPLDRHVCGSVVPRRARLAQARRVAPLVAALVLVSTATATLVTRETPGRNAPEPADATFLAPAAVAAQLSAAARPGVRMKLPIGQRSALAEFQPERAAPRIVRHIPSA